jgi:hypothetical protein
MLRDASFSQVHLEQYSSVFPQFDDYYHQRHIPNFNSAPECGPSPKDRGSIAPSDIYIKESISLSKLVIPDKNFPRESDQRSIANQFSESEFQTYQNENQASDYERLYFHELNRNKNLEEDRKVLKETLEKMKIDKDSQRQNYEDFIKQLDNEIQFLKNYEVRYNEVSDKHNKAEEEVARKTAEIEKLKKKGNRHDLDPILNEMRSKLERLNKEKVELLDNMLISRNQINELNTKIYVSKPTDDQDRKHKPVRRLKMPPDHVLTNSYTNIDVPYTLLNQAEKQRYDIPDQEVNFDSNTNGRNPKLNPEVYSNPPERPSGPKNYHSSNKNSQIWGTEANFSKSPFLPNPLIRKNVQSTPKLDDIDDKTSLQLGNNFKKPEKPFLKNSPLNSQFFPSVIEVDPANPDNKMTSLGSEKKSIAQSFLKPTQTLSSQTKKADSQKGEFTENIATNPLTNHAAYSNDDYFNSSPEFTQFKPQGKIESRPVEPFRQDAYSQSIPQEPPQPTYFQSGLPQTNVNNSNIYHSVNFANPTIELPYTSRVSYSPYRSSIIRETVTSKLPTTTIVHDPYCPNCLRVFPRTCSRVITPVHSNMYTSDIITHPTTRVSTSYYNPIGTSYSYLPITNAYSSVRSPSPRVSYRTRVSIDRPYPSVITTKSRVQSPIYRTTYRRSISPDPAFLRNTTTVYKVNNDPIDIRQSVNTLNYSSSFVQNKKPAEVKPPTPIYSDSQYRSPENQTSEYKSTSIRTTVSNSNPNGAYLNIQNSYSPRNVTSDERPWTQTSPVTETGVYSKTYQPPRDSYTSQSYNIRTNALPVTSMTDFRIPDDQSRYNY